MQRNKDDARSAKIIRWTVRVAAIVGGFIGLMFVDSLDGRLGDVHT